MPSSFIRSRCGVTLLNVSLILVLIGGLVIAGYAMMGPIIKRGKITDTKTTINSAVDAIISWSVARGHIPGTEAQFNEASVNQYDAWGRKLRYLYDVGLSTVSSSNEICNRNSTAFRINGDDIAFVVLSLGDDYTFTSSWDGDPALSDDDSVIIHKTDETLPNKNSASLVSPDIYRTVTLNELKAKIGCFGKTGGRLRIVNNELPNGCIGDSYSATIFADGGKPFDSNKYEWSISSLPIGVTSTPNAIYPNWSPTPSATLQLGGNASSGNIVIYVRDNHTPEKTVVQRSYSLQTVSCGSTIPTVPEVTPADFNGGESGDGGVDVQGDKITWKNTNGDLSTDSKNGTGSNCIWYQSPLTLTGLNLAAYFDFTFRDGEGFVFALVSKTQDPPISYCSKDLLGFGDGIPTGPLGTLLGVEFNAATKSICVATDGTICSGPANLWTADGSRYHVRIDLNRAAKQVEVRMCKHGSANCTTTETDKLKAITAVYTGSLSPIIAPQPPTLTLNNLSDLNNFYFGITAGQHDNDNLIMTISDLMVDLY